MRNSRSFALRGALSAAAAILPLCTVSGALAQQSEDTEVQQVIAVSPADVSQAGEATHGYLHPLAARVPGALERISAARRDMAQNAPALGLSEASNDATSDAFTSPAFYPGDLTSLGGPALQTSTHHALYINFTGSVASNWGNPERFLRDLNVSSFIHLSDQYVGTTENDRYPVGQHARVRYSLSANIIWNSDLAVIVHAAAVRFGAGGGHIYHMFLPKGLDTCYYAAPNVPVCYSPDNPATWGFCAYHGAFGFTDIGTVLITVEPYQNIPGCQVATPGPSGQLADSTNSALSHETFETITDPLPLSGWVNVSDNLLFGSEIGDECQPVSLAYPSGFAPQTFRIGNHEYAVQPEYSNSYHACATQP